MIVLRVRGGLGNQLFQYAAGSALAAHHNTSLKLDLYFYKKRTIGKHTARRFELDKFKIPLTMATRAEVHQFTGANPIVRFLNKRENYWHCPQVLAQPYYHFYEDFFRYPAPLYLTGYWQSEKYFLPVQTQIRAWYQPVTPLDTRNQALVAEMHAGESVSLHVRRGDYTQTNYQSFFGVLTQAYYDKAIEMMGEKVTNPQFFVFSDDIAWCKKNLALPRVTFVEHNTGADSYKDLFLMSQCKHNIIANSSFSWWGAWLNNNASKVVIAPARWFQREFTNSHEVVYPCRVYNTKDQIPQGWITL